ncbi:retrovirus-related Pol polyprotein from transposon 297 [Trichonephila inaurata madagascariensis]|uniref:RNA-directed DNA polymerase n=1 Tax=Trichonephila inaurata madagascariensis TaxID=2747483 RepID=A0A8X7BW94_9ARAC|nr:retrovirus-related Pol polyprotein from transposon 297 [Trichonephila inaurata madagascariensis]
MCLCYLDDIIEFSLTFNDHLRRLHCVLSCIQEAGLVLNPKKCYFGATEIKVLGHLVSGKGVKPDPDKLKAVNSFPTPKKIHDVRSFLGLCSYYRRFIKNLCFRAKPLQQLLKGDSKFHWEKAQEDSFRDLKSALTSPPVLALYDENAPTELHTDARKKYADADYLSRNPISIIPEIESLAAISDLATEQRDDPSLAAFVKACEQSPDLSSAGFSIVNNVLCKKKFDPSGKQWLPVVPKKMRLEILHHFHDEPTAGHLGFVRTYHRIRKRFFWPRLFRIVRSYVTHYRECQRRKAVPLKPPGTLIPIPLAEAPFQRIGMDLLGRFLKL